MLDVILAEHGRPLRFSKNKKADALGLSKTRFYTIWKGMKDRCYKKHKVAYAYYGARGVTVCDRWFSFRCFFEDMAPTYYAGATIDRIDSGKGYSPENCRWSTPKEQARNRKTNRYITVDGTTKCLAEWAEYLGCNPSIFNRRVYKYGPEKAVVMTRSGS